MASVFSIQSHQKSQFTHYIDLAVKNHQIDERTARFAKSIILKNQTNFDMNQFQNWAQTRVSSHDSHGQAASSLLLNIANQVFHPPQQAVTSLTNPLNQNLETFRGLLDNAARNSAILPQTAKCSFQQVANHLHHLDHNLFNRWADTQVSSHDRNPHAATIVKQLFSQAFGVTPSNLTTSSSLVSPVVKQYQYPVISENRPQRAAIRDNTFEFVKNNPLQASDIHEAISLTGFALPPGDIDPQQRDALLPKYGALTVTGLPPISYGASWEPNKLAYAGSMFPQGLQNRSLSMTYIAAINIGESSCSADAPAYRNADGTLNEDKFLQDMFSVFQAGFMGQIENGASQLVWNPVGMGAFLRHIGDNFRGITPLYVEHLRFRIAEQLIKAFDTVKFPSAVLHLCLYTGNPESDSNYNVFNKAILSAQQKSGQAYENVIIHKDGDMLEIAQHLANKHGDNTVNVIIAANRKLLGNCWFNNGAFRASDENIHRRWPRAAQIAAYLNNGFQKGLREENELRKRVNYLTSVNQPTFPPSANPYNVGESNNNPHISNEIISQSPQEASILTHIMHLLTLFITFLASLTHPRGNNSESP